MSMLPVSQLAPFLKESVIPKEPAGAAGGRPSEAAPKESLKGDENASSFRRIFQEKKTEREQAAQAKSAHSEAGAKEAVPQKIAGAVQNSRSAVRQAALAKAESKHSTLKELLSALVDKNAKGAEIVRKEKAPSRDREKKTEGFVGERIQLLRERLEAARKKDGDHAQAQAIRNRPGREKAERRAVIIDLRDPAAEKAKQPSPAAKAGQGKNPERAEFREAKKPAAAPAASSAESRDQFDVKIFAKSGQIPDALEGARQAAGETAVPARNDFSARMAEVMKNEMVKHAGLVLRNGGNGEIHLVLKPESLGSVRIKLNLEDNHIVGKIIVDNNIVKEIMEENLGHLETALRDNGYEAAAFDVFVAGEKGQASDRENDFAARLDASDGRETLRTTEYEATAASIYDDALVNIVL